jgi:hypothetical protein
MKAGHRQELQTNLLADRMGRLLQSMKTPRDTRTRVGWAFAILIIVSVVVWQIYASATQSDHSELWLRLDAAIHDSHRGATERELAIVIQDGRGTFAARAARFDQARLKFEEGLSPFSAFQRAESAKAINEARQIYEELIGQCADQPILAQEAMMGVAKADESLIGIAAPIDIKKDLNKALASYKRLAERYPQSPLGEEAQKRVSELEAKKPEVERFYAELAESTDVGKVPDASAPPMNP